MNRQSAWQIKRSTTDQLVLPQAEEDQQTRHRMRWFFLLLLTIWIIAAFAMTLLTYWFTGNPLSFSLFSTLLPPVALLMWIAKYLFRDDRDIYLAALKIHAHERYNHPAPFVADMYQVSQFKSRIPMHKRSHSCIVMKSKPPRSQ